MKNLLLELKIITEKIKTREDNVDYNLPEDKLVYDNLKLPLTTEFFISRHLAKIAGEHNDIRLKLKKDYWYCFVSRKNIGDLVDGLVKKLGIYPTTIHNDNASKTIGFVDEGYGAGELQEWDSGKCIINRWNLDSTISIEFFGSKIKGKYYIIKPESFDKGYLFFKSTKK